ncbi:6224_t:CDS:2 [Dentiscutata erythropus]|uniref:6224_t:CDS:1 n=1 Tax=Dentiscutata erythropus TaxID=1348616 RepID=A0A9N9GBZ9_9GLOM|nr:6224_t:CDS:2 [Dentiscutata erythropus]
MRKTETAKLKDGESTGWIKVLKKPSSRLNNRVTESKSSNRVTVDPQTNTALQANNLVDTEPQQKLTKQKSRVTLKQSSLSQFFQLENRFENNQLNTAKEVNNTSRQNQTIKPPAKKQSSRKRKDAQEETIGKYVKQGQNRQITLTICFENSMNFYARLRATKEKSNAGKNCEKINNRIKKTIPVKTNNIINGNEKIQRKLVDFFRLKNQHIKHSQNTIIGSEFQNLPNSASVNGSTTIDVNQDLSQECSNNPPDDLNGAKSKKCLISSKKRLGISYWQNRDDQQMPQGNSYHLSNFTVLTDDSFITTSSRLSPEISSDKHPRKSSKNIHCDGGNVHDKEFEKGPSVQISNSPLQTNVNPLLEMNNDKRLVSVQNNPTLVAASKSVSRRMPSPDKNCENADNDNLFDLDSQEHKENKNTDNFQKNEDLDSNMSTRNIKLTEQTEALDVPPKQEALFCSTSPVSSPSSFFSQSQIIDEMGHQDKSKEIPRSRTPDYLAIQERLIKSGISPAPSPPSLFSQGAFEQMSLSTLEQMPSLNMCTLQFDDFDDLF